MGYDLSGKGGDWCHFNVPTWPWVLALAFVFGWRPAGTAAPTFNEGGECDPDPDWDGGYFSNDHQAVLEPDARAMGEALHGALETARRAKEGDLEARADLDQRLAEAAKLTRTSEAEIAPFGAELGMGPTEPLLFDTRFADKIRKFADMAGKGPFSIG
jgi:hypothetical protein